MEDIPAVIFECELKSCGIVPEDGGYTLQLNGEECYLGSLVECRDRIEENLKEKKRRLFGQWKMLSHLCDIALQEPRYNDSPCLNNILFLNVIKKSHLLSLIFDELKDVTQSIEKIFDIDISRIDELLVEQINETYMEIRCLHTLVMNEIYRMKLIEKCDGKKEEKVASVAGPWNNLDLVYRERVIDWNTEMGEEMNERTDARQKQTRYNPEYNQYGIYLTWVEDRRAPYRFGDYDDSPYPHDSFHSIA